MPLTICVALLQRRLPGNVTGQLPSLGIETMALSLCQFFEGPLRAGEQLSVVVALADELCADWHAGRSLEDRDRNGRHMQRGPDLVQRHAGKGRHADRRFAE